MNFKIALQFKQRLSGYALALLLIFPSSITQAQQQKILQLEKGSLEQAIAKIRIAFNVVIAYNKSDIAGVNIDGSQYKDQTVEQVLTEILKGTALSFKKNGTSYVLLKTPASKSPNVLAGGGPGTIKGRIVEFETSQPLPGASVYIVELKKGMQSNNEGYYNFNNIPAGKYTLRVTYVSYTTENIQVEAKAGKEETYDIKLRGASSLNEVIVSATRKSRAPVAHSSEREVLEEVKSSSLVVSAISSEQITKSADRNAAEVMQRVSGVTTVDDKFVVVRGLNQRYNLTYLNDNVAPSTETYSRAFALDLIPSRIIDKILVFKSPSPENQADATGGVIKIYTKDAKNVKHFDIDVQGGYRAGTTLNSNFLTYEGGKFDFLGFDDGTRKLPVSVPSYGNLNKAKISQSEYIRSFSPVLTYGRKTALPNLQLTANYYNSFNVFGKSLSMLSSLSYKNERQHADVYRQQGIGEAVSTDNINFDNRNTETAQLNLLQNFKFRLKDSSNIEFKNFLLQQGQTSTIVRLTYPTVFPRNSNINTANKDNILSYTQRFLYAGNLGGTHYYDSGKHKLQWNGGYTYSRQETPDQRVIRFTAPTSLAVPGDTTLQWKSRGRGNNADDEISPIPVTLGMISRLWSRSAEGVYNASADYTYKFKPWLFLRAGTFQQWKQRRVFRRVYTVHEGDFKGGIISDYYTTPGGYGQYVDPNLVRFPEQDLGQVWSEDYFREDGSGLKVFDRTQGSDAYVATEQNNSGYAAFGFTPANRKIEIYGGLRFEYNRQKIGAAIPPNANQPNSINYPVLVDNPTTNWLPSVNASYRPDSSWVIRVAYGKTLNRYEFREASPYLEVDYENNLIIYGNPLLKTATANNYDFRIEYYPRNNAKGETISIGAFYKDLKNPIERINNSSRVLPELNTITFQNATSATIKGLELELRKSLDFLPGKVFRDLSVIANASLIRSEAVKDSADLAREQEENGPDNRLTTIKRPLQGQAPYIVNAGLYYDNAGSGTRFSANYNIVGTRIYAAGTALRTNSFIIGPENRGSLLELPRHSVDIALTQRIIKSLQLKFSVQNLLDKTIEMAEDYNFTGKYEPVQNIIREDGTQGKAGDNIASRFNPGRYFILSLSYSL